ncbi:MAG: hypothetical protein J0M33_19835 [Anaerolineae bacterium]|nr:hypothetical protein [Anaerolineae bacterium]
MAKRNAMAVLEKEKGDLHKVIPPLVNAGGQKLAATELNVSQATISEWLTRNRYVRKVQYVPLEAQPE